MAASRDSETTSKDRAQLKLFISYSRRDSDTADTLVAALEANGMDVTIDRRDLPYGEIWQSELADFIRMSDTVVWLVSPDSVTSKWCNWELGEVQRLNKRMLPVRIRSLDSDTLPEALGKIHLLPATGVYKPDLHFDLLLGALNTDRAWVKEATRHADRARQWIVKDRDTGLLLRGRALVDAEEWRHRQPGTAPPPGQEILDLILESRQAATRRSRYWLVGALSLMAFSAGGGLWSWSQKLEADRQREAALEQKAAAERNFNQSIDAAESLAIGLAGDIRDFTGVRRERIEGLLGRAETVYDRLSATGITPRLERSKSLMLQEAARTYTQLGNLTEARLRAERAVALARKGLAPQSENADRRRDLIRALLALAEVLRAKGDVAPMRAALDESVSLWRMNLASDPGNDVIRRELGKGLQSVAMFLVPADRPAARTHMQEAVETLQEVSQKSPGEETLLDFWGAMHDFAVLVWGEGDMETARTSFEIMTTLGRVTLRQYPGNERMQHLQLRGLQRLADLSGLMRKKQEAANAEAEALVHAEARASAAPDSFQAQLDLAFSLQRLAGFRIDLGQRDSARQSAIKSIEIARGLKSRDPENSEAADFFVRMLKFTSLTLLELGEQGLAVEAASQALAIAERRLNSDLSSQPLQLQFVESLDRVVGSANPDEALAVLDKHAPWLSKLQAEGKLTGDPATLFGALESYRPLILAAKEKGASRWIEP